MQLPFPQASEESFMSLSRSVLVDIGPVAPVRLGELRGRMKRISDNHDSLTGGFKLQRYLTKRVSHSRQRADARSFRR